MNIISEMLSIYESNKEHVDNLNGFDVLDFMRKKINERKEISVNWNLVKEIYGDEYHYVAMDEDGGWRAYTSKPLIHDDGYWIANNDVEDYINVKHLVLNYDAYYIDWVNIDYRNTLQIKTGDVN